MRVNPSREFWHGRRVLITGHSGFKGSWLTLWLNQMGAEIMGLSADDRKQHELFYAANIQDSCVSVFADLRQPKTWSETVFDFKPEVVFHLAAQSLVQKSYDEPVDTFEINVLGTVHLLEVLRHHKNVKSIVVATTDKVYRDVHLRKPFKEDDHLGGHDPYSASKAACEIAVDSYKKSYFEIQSTALSVGRAGNVIGGGDWAANRLIPDAIRAWSDDVELVVRNPDHIRPWQHVLEPLLGYLILGEKTSANPKLAGPFNFGPLEADQVTVGEIINLAARRFPSAKVSFVAQQDLKHESEWLDLDSNRANDQLSVRSRLSTEQSVNWTIDWYSSFLSGQSAMDLCLGQINNYLSLAAVS